MTAQRIPLAASGPDFALLLLLSAIWGGSFPLIKIAVGDLPPLWVAAGRISLGGLALLVILRLRGATLPRGGFPVWGRLAFMGIVGNVVPFALIGWGEIQVPSGVAAILMAMVPLMVVVIAHFWVPDEPLTGAKLAGIGFGLAGILMLIGPSALAGLGNHVAGELAILLATVCYALTAVIGRGLPPLSADAASSGMLLAAAPVGLVAAALVDPPAALAPTASALAAVAVLGIVCTGLAFVVFFRMLARAGAGFASMNNFLVPPFGVIYGWLGLGEKLPPTAFLAMLLISLGVLVQRLQKTSSPLVGED
jgi:drug/metabolite transporter (DMT)-like permease